MTPRHAKAARALVALTLLALLSGCIVVPVGYGPPPGYYRPHYYYGR